MDPSGGLTALSALHDSSVPHAQHPGLHRPDPEYPEDHADPESGGGHLGPGEGREGVPEGGDRQRPAHPGERGYHDPEGQRSL